MDFLQIGNLFLHDTIALVTILNPLAAASIMLGMITAPTPGVIRPIAWRATLTIVIAGLVTLYTGEFLFKLFGINVPSIKVIGGVILMMIAINMAYGQPSKARHTPEEKEEAQSRVEENEDISIVPLGIPILFGPGVIATIVVLNHNHQSELHNAVESYLLVSVALLASAACVYFSLRYAGTINRLLGVTGMKILTRIMGLVVGAIAAQFLVSGIRVLWGGN